MATTADIPRLEMLQVADMGVMATINQAIDPDTAELVVTEMGHRPKRVAEGDVETGLAEAVDAPESLLPRPPVVTIMQISWFPAARAPTSGP